jgi:hypothetical protein
MPAFTQTIKELEVLFLKAKHRDPSKYQSKEDDDIVIDAYNAMSVVEKHGYVELIPYLYHFIDDPDEYLREKAVQSFRGFGHAQIPEFREIAFNIWNNKNEENCIRYSAFSLWCDSYQITKDPQVLKILYRILKDKNVESALRSGALTGIMQVIGDGQRCIIAHNLWLDIFDIKDPYEFDTKINWEEVDYIMNYHAPEFL